MNTQDKAYLREIHFETDCNSWRIENAHCSVLGTCVVEETARYSMSSMVECVAARVESKPALPWPGPVTATSCSRLGNTSS